MIQDDVFARTEGDAWFRRNAAALDAPGHVDWPLRLLECCPARAGIGSVAELGCAHGYRLARLRSQLPAARRLAGVDASAQAIAEGRHRFEGLELHHGTLADVPLAGPFDLVIVHFVLHWVDRAHLARCVAEIDRLVRDGGWLLLGDFLPERPQRRRYHHVTDAALYTYKQDYAAVFEALATYRRIAEQRFDHDHPGREAAADPRARGVCVLMQKSLAGFYEEDA